MTSPVLLRFTVHNIRVLSCPQSKVIFLKKIITSYFKKRIFKVICNIFYLPKKDNTRLNKGLKKILQRFYKDILKRKNKSNLSDTSFFITFLYLFR